MPNPTIKIVDLLTGEEEVRAMNAEELASFIATQQEQIQVEEAAVAKAETKAALLNRLGITAEEAKLLLG